MSVPLSLVCLARRPPSIGLYLGTRISSFKRQMEVDGFPTFPPQKRPSPRDGSSRGYRSPESRNFCSATNPPSHLHLQEHWQFLLLPCQSLSESSRRQGLINPVRRATIC